MLAGSLVGALLLGATAFGAAATAVGSVTVTGTLERLVADTATGDSTRYAVRGEERSWWLEEVPRPLPPIGSRVEVTGTPVDEHSLDVTTIEALDADARSDAAATAPASTDVLVIRVFWNASPPSSPTTDTTYERTITASQKWFDEVSHGRYSVSGTVTPWLKVTRPDDCFDSSFVMMDRALAAAENAGYQPSDYGRIILYLPCSTGPLGLASTPGPYIWLYGTLGRAVVVHEQGHNLGLVHARSRLCVKGDGSPAMWSKDCVIDEYGDSIDAMGNRAAGHFSAAYKRFLGWLPRYTTVTSSKTVRLTPFETPTGGFMAIRLPATDSDNFWLEYRTRAGLDKVMRPGSAGVQIRLENLYGTQLLDGSPGIPPGSADYQDVHLPSGKSWTTPQGVRISVGAQSSSGVDVTMTFGARMPQPSS